MKASKKKLTNKEKTPQIISSSDTVNGIAWLESLDEHHFRDEILKELFHRMRGEETIVDFIYTHGRFEKGGLSSRFIGVQAKSKKITRQSSDSRSDSAINVKQQCESAYDHKFNWNGNEIRLDVVELWMSKHITEDAESEFNAPLARHKVAVKKSSEIFSLIERYCPRIIAKIPGLAEAGYIKNRECWGRPSHIYI